MRLPRLTVCLPALLLGLALGLGGCASQRPGPAADAPARPAPAVATALSPALLDRLTWGLNPSALALARADGADWLPRQLRGSPAPLAPAVQAGIDAMTISRVPLPELMADLDARRRAADAQSDEAARQQARQDLQQELNRLAREAASRHLLRALYAPDQVRAQMTWFWFNHFNVAQGKRDLRALVGDYEEQALRPHALGRFRDLLGAVVRHPAMLRYLDADQNAAGRINENLARELMELHTLGVDGGYTQEDVQALARVLTGLGVRIEAGPAPVRRELQPLYVRQGLMEFHPGRHEFAPHRLLGQLLPGQGLAEIDAALDRLARHPSTARFISRKLAQWWLSDVPPERLVQAMAQRFQATDGDIAAVLELLFQDPAFATPGKFKDPMRFVVSALRLAWDDRRLDNLQPALGWLARLGQPLYGRQTPDGWPLEAAAWNGPGQLALRFEVARAIASGPAGLQPQATDAARPAFPRLDNEAFHAVLAPRLGPATRNALAQAGSPQEWGTLLLSSPEFNTR